MLPILHDDVEYINADTFKCAEVSIYECERLVSLTLSGFENLNNAVF